MHTNSTVGISPPVVALDDGGTYHPSKAQRWLWQSYINFVDRVQATINAHPGATVSLICNGDMVEGDTKNRSKQIISRNKSTILNMTADVLKPLVDISHRAFFLRGTGAHVGKSAELEEELAKDCTITERYSPEVFSRWWLRAELGGVLFHIQHHGPTRANKKGLRKALDDLAEGLILQACNQRLPAVAVYSHGHLHACTHDNYPVMVVSTPAWQLMAEYMYRKPLPETSDIGGLIFVCDKGSYTWEKMLYKPEAVKPWKSPIKTSGMK